MRLCALCFFLVSTLVIAAPTRQLTLLLQFAEQPSDVSVSAIDAELQHILKTSHVPLSLTVRTRPLHGEVAGELVVFKMKGTCSMDGLPVAALSDERGPLAMTHIVDGEMLPFADVECNRVRRSLQRTFGSGNPHFHQRQYGVALARVMAHELYHMLAKSTAHDTEGLTRSGLSSQDLATGTMQLSNAARLAIGIP